MASSHAIRVHDLQRDELPLPVAFLLSCLLSVGIALTAVLTLQNAVRPVPKPAPLHVVLLQLPSQPPRPLVAPPPAALPPPTVAITVPVAPSGHVVAGPRPSLPVPARRPPRPPHRARHAAERQAATEPPARPAAATPQASTISSPQADPAARDSLQARIREAIHSSFHYPEAARVTGTHGTAVVGFLYRDRSALAIRIIQSSLSSILDRAAIGIVRDAEMPPPGKLAGQTLSLEVPVVFDLSTDDD